MDDSGRAAELPLRLTVAPIAAARLGDTPAAAVQLGFEPPLSGRPGPPETVDVAMTIYNEIGHPVETRERRVEADLRAPDGRSVAHQMLERFDLKPGRYQVSIRAHARERDAHGSILAGFTVPDFNRAALAMSGVVISEPSPPAGASPDALRDLWPVAPTTERVFPATGEATAFVRVYQGTRPAPGPVSVSIQVVDERGQAVRDHAETLDSTQFGSTRTAEVSFPLPLSVLGPGSYSLSVEARRDGQPPVNNRVAFAVRNR
jgi:hypothetical protein